ncbi:2-succinyl-5-enolpyruvyl-6-hydroxy-3-cyclohexene- 1-carboxylic-acid synthase [Georgenia halophila]|uniref:2-succinyl-5-enolpyruvyl-6-hydroxy-3-cyclohexene-1-carboxylate synthase n=1 Tax=Georgenia halophila TaxID=620889 RepID=A0ABP8KWQ8_9MICO
MIAGSANEATSATATARTLVIALVAHGVRHVVLAPGSRSAPLAYALHDAERAGWLTLHVRLDERGVGFLALGIARGSGRPVAVVTTSGTAVANLHPAVLEAAHSGVPLIVLSADRPHEMRGTGANQTTDQVGIFGAAVRHAVDLPAAPAPGSLAQIVTRALAAARGLRTNDPGPVHLNIGLRDPLVPEAPWNAGAPPTHRDVVAPTSAPAAATLPRGPRTVVVAGDGAGPAARALAEQAAWPLLAEPTSGARSGPTAIGPYRLLLTEPALGGAVERVVLLGHPTLSRPVSGLLGRADVEVVVVAPHGAWTDVAGTASRVVGAVDLQDVAPGPGRMAGQEWLTSWQRAAEAATTVIERSLDAGTEGPGLDGLQVAGETWAARGVGALVVGSSNPIRDLDLIAPPAADGAPPVLANRGLAGIDGTLATATGVALGLDLPVRALVGDLTFLHDAGSLARGALECDVDLQVVVANDGGGSIFATLEHGAPERAATYERLFGTPQDVDLAALAAAYGARYVRVTTAGDLRATLQAPLRGRSVVEVAVDRSNIRARRRELAAAVSRAVRPVLG